jgi:hypothetical protein
MENAKGTETPREGPDRKQMQNVVIAVTSADHTAEDLG